MTEGEQVTQPKSKRLIECFVCMAWLRQWLRFGSALFHGRVHFVACEIFDSKVIASRVWLPCICKKDFKCVLRIKCGLALNCESPKLFDLHQNLDFAGSTRNQVVVLFIGVLVETVSRPGLSRIHSSVIATTSRSFICRSAYNRGDCSLAYACRISVPVWLKHTVEWNSNRIGHRAPRRTTALIFMDLQPKRLILPG